MAKEKIPEELGLALVLTVYEAKGLEFDDVLLYNFFTDSEVCLFKIQAEFDHLASGVLLPRGPRHHYHLPGHWCPSQGFHYFHLCHP